MNSNYMAKVSEDSDWEPMDRLNPVLHKMKAYGVKEATVEFYGGGDSGQIEQVLFDKNVPEACKVRLEVQSRTHKYDEETQSYSYEVKTEIVEKSLEDALEKITYDLLDESGVDWYNNEGGGGHLKINLHRDKPHVEFEVYYNVIESHTGHYSEVGVEL